MIKIEETCFCDICREEINKVLNKEGQWPEVYNSWELCLKHKSESIKDINIEHICIDCFYKYLNLFVKFTNIGEKNG